MRVTFDETNIGQNYKMNMAVKHNMDSDSVAYVKYIYEIFANSVTSYLALKKSKEGPVVFALRDLKGNFKFGAIVGYEEADSSDMPGNWNYNFTFDEKDIEDVATQYSINDNEFTIILRNEANAHCGIVFAAASYCYDTFDEAISTLLEYLEANAPTDGDVLEIELPGYFVATAGIEDGIKTYSITPSAALKQAIKDDKAV